jgi:hypothetical protein
MSRSRWVGIAAALATASVLGWVVDALWRESPAAPSQRQAPAQRTPTVLTSARPTVTVLGDGMVSIHVDRTSVAWLLRELERQGARLPSAAQEIPAGTTSLASGESDAAEPDSSESDRLVIALSNGTEDDRQAAIRRARDQSIDLPAGLLRQTFETDSSESVRVLAFTTYIDTAMSDAESIREALTSGTFNSSAAVQAEARKRLTEFEIYQELVAATPPQGDP